SSASLVSVQPSGFRLSRPAPAESPAVLAGCPRNRPVASVGHASPSRDILFRAAPRTASANQELLYFAKPPTEVDATYEMSLRVTSITPTDLFLSFHYTHGLILQGAFAYFTGAADEKDLGITRFNSFPNLPAFGSPQAHALVGRNDGAIC